MITEGSRGRIVSKDNDSNKLLDRRTAIKHGLAWWLKTAAIQTTGVVAINIIGQALQGTKIEAAQEQQKAELTHSPEERVKLAVKSFSGDIAHASKRISGDTSVEDIVGMVSGWFGATAIGGYMLEGQSVRSNRLIGAGAAVTGRTVDMVSTVTFVSQMQDPRFTDYGLDAYFAEGDAFFASANPSVQDVLTKGAGTAAVFGFGAFMFPPFGRGYAGASPFILRTNYTYSHMLGLSFDLGDEVRDLIAAGKKPEEIKNYLLNTRSKGDSSPPKQRKSQTTPNPSATPTNTRK